MMTELQDIYSKKDNTLKYKFGIREKTLLSIFLFTFFLAMVMIMGSLIL